MGNIPRQRKPGQTGGMGGHGRNMHRAQRRDMGGSKPPKKGSGGGSKAMSIVAWALIGIPATGIGAIVGFILHGKGVL